MNRPSLLCLKPSVMRAAVAVTMAMVLIILTPFASALEIHHALAAADHDGHEHSASDLCQCVQHHTGSSILSIGPPLAAFLAVTAHPLPHPLRLFSVRLISISHPRAPPIS